MVAREVMEFEEFVARRIRGLPVEEDVDEDLRPSKPVSSSRIDCSLVESRLTKTIPNTLWEGVVGGGFAAGRVSRSGKVFSSGGWTIRRLS